MQSSCKSNGIELGRFAETPSQKLNHTLTCEYYCFLILQLTASYVPGLNRSLTQVTAVANEFVETQQQSVYCVVSLSTLGSCIFIASKDARNHSWNTISKAFLGSMLSNPARCIAQSQLIDNLNESPPYLPPNSKRCLQPWPCSNITCSAKFLRRIIFTVFADSFGTAKIKLLETFRLNFLGVRGIVWKQAIPLLQSCVDVKSNMALYCCFKANASRFLGAAIVTFFDDTSCICQWGGVFGSRRVVDELKQTNQEGPR